ncbi:MAG: amidohydrolase [Verrucomicrobiae bacterium]|nr:amidohydrolase [Verrucomicrobiae bacterium]
MKRIDGHVHILGDELGSNGCQFSPGWRLPMVNWMLHHLGLPPLRKIKNLDQQYIERLLELVRTSSLDAIVILAHEHVYDEQGKRIDLKNNYHIPNSYVLQLAKKYSEFLPAVSIHPTRADAMDELDRCLEGGAAMMKILPNCHNINCNNPRYKKFWERMAQVRLPLLAHTGGEHTLPILNKKYADPEVLRLPLECGVNVIAAHSATKSGLFDPNYLEKLVFLMTQYSNLYADNSAFNIPFRSRYFKRALESPLIERMVHGSDFPVLIYGHWAWMRGLIDWQTFRQWQNQPNVLERDYQIKKAIGFPEETFTRMNHLLRFATG